MSILKLKKNNITKMTVKEICNALEEHKDLKGFIFMGITAGENYMILDSRKLAYSDQTKLCIELIHAARTNIEAKLEKFKKEGIKE